MEGLCPSSSDDYDAIYQESINHPERFWGDLGRRRLKWFTPFDRVMKCDMRTGEFKWFLGGKINVSVNCIDRHVEVHPDKPALIWEKEKPGQHEIVTYKQLLEMTCRIANVLKRCGVQKGNCVAIYMPVCPLLVGAMMACARIGAIHSVIFGGFGSPGAAGQNSGRYIFTVDQVDDCEYKQTVNVAVKGLDNSHQVEHILVDKRSDSGVNMKDGERDIWLQEAMAEVTAECPPEELDSEDELFILYTSGSTGKPKGIVHTQAGYLLYASLTQQELFYEYAFDYHPESDIFACVADIGWITGHSYVVYGPLCNGGTTVLYEGQPTHPELYEGQPTHPDPGRYWEMVSRLKVTHFYAALTTIRKLLRYGDGYVKAHDRSSLRVLGCVGEPLDEATWHWYNEVVGENKCAVVDTYWQTETGGIIISPLPSPNAGGPRSCFPMRPFWGILPELLTKDGIQIGNVSGQLCIRKPWPGQARTIWKNKEQFRELYYEPHKNYYFTGDGALRDRLGDYMVTGRVDDVIEINGRQIGTAEIESVLNMDSRVSQTAVIQTVKDNRDVVVAFVTLKEGEIEGKDIIRDLEERCTQTFQDFVPNVFVVPDLPMTRSGKIMRRLLRKIAANEANEDQLGDISTFANKEVIRHIIDKYNNR